MFIHKKVLINDNAEVRDTVGRSDHGVAQSDLCDVDLIPPTEVVTVVIGESHLQRVSLL